MIGSFGFYTFCYKLYNFAINIVSFSHDKYLTEKLYRLSMIWDNKVQSHHLFFQVVFDIFLAQNTLIASDSSYFTILEASCILSTVRIVRYHTSATSNTFCFFSKNSASFPRRNLHVFDTGDFSDLCNHIYRYSINQRNVLRLCVVGKTKIYKINSPAEHE